MSAGNITMWLGLILSALALLGLVYRAVRRVEAVLGKDDQGRSVNQRLDRVEHQLWPNGGTSLADKVNKQAESLAEQRIEQRIVRDLLTGLIETRCQPQSGNVRPVFIEKRD